MTQDCSSRVAALLATFARAFKAGLTRYYSSEMRGPPRSRIYILRIQFADACDFWLGINLRTMENAN
jgi:hypothetical protein